MAELPTQTEQKTSTVTTSSTPVEPPHKVPTSQRPKMWTALGGIVACAAASFFGAWLLLATGLVHPDASKTITDNKQTLALQQGEIVSEVFKKVSPSTVAITTESVDSSSQILGPQVSQGAGSGIIISADGYILTNKHVVPSGTNKVTVVLSDGKQYNDVKIVGRDPSNDIAFLKINGVSNLSAATIGDSSKITPGQQVVAIGNALGLFRNSVTSGIISGIGRPIQASDESGSGTAEQLEDMFQTDAAINPGNSGGPLVDLKGEVIGMNTAVSQDGQSIGFAIPMNDAKGQINSVLKGGTIQKPYLGVRYISLTPEIAKQLNISTSSGAYVHGDSGQSGIVAGSPAAKAGIRDGDIITKINGQQITADSGLATKLTQFNPGDKVDLTVVRGGQEQTISVTLNNYPQQ
ncbi:MAG TPA: trypsin-like peptidase domain-containing protein [Candidatus Saccharimonas sp.]|nr:trypsin-like peptidase domain-containing protein [Candidatus Saccharimonas sp.]